MNITIKTAEQKQFEEWAQIFLSILATMTPAARTEVFNYMVYVHNTEKEKGTE